MTLRRLWCMAAPLILGATQVLWAQERQPDSTLAPASHAVDSSVVLLHPGQTHDTLAAPAPAPTKSPGTAMLLSAILPGAGQFYNESYWKVPIATGLAIYFVSEWLTNNRRYISSRDLATNYRLSLPATPNADQNAYLSGLIQVREFYKDQRDSFAWYYLILYVVSIADAYVDASLYGFSVGGSLSAGNAQPPMLTLRFRF